MCGVGVRWVGADRGEEGGEGGGGEHADERGRVRERQESKGFSGSQMPWRCLLR